MTAPTTAGGAVLPVVAWLHELTTESYRETAITSFSEADPWADALKDVGRAVISKSLTPRDAAQAEIDALRAENEQWKSTLWAVARELNCLPSTFSDGNAHVFKAAISLRAERDAAFAMSRCECSPDEGCANLAKLRAELAALKAAQDDQALVSHAETVSAPGASLKADVLHLTDEGRRCITLPAAATKEPK